MDVQVNNLTAVSREVEITVTAAEAQPHFEKKYAEYRAKLDIKGFRKGKAPIDIVKKLYGEMIENDSLQDVATEFYRDVVKQKDLKPIGDPALTDMDYKRGEQFRFKIQYDVRPAVELKPYKGLKVRKPKHTVTDAEVEAEVLRLRRMNGTTEPATKVESEDYIVTANLQDLDESGAPIIGKRSEGVRFFLADEQLEEPFKVALKHAEEGGEYRVQFEHQHGDHSHTVNTRVTATKVEKVVLPPFDDAFVTKITKDKVTTTSEFLTGLRNDIEEYWKNSTERALMNSITGELLALHEFDVPESLTRAVAEGLLKDMAAQYPKKQLPPDFDYDRFWHENHDYAKAQAKWALLREEIIRAEQLTVEDADLTAIAEREAAKINIDTERLLQYYKTSDQVKDRILTDKLMERLKSLVTVEEVADTSPTSGTKGS